jgi:hypothetical protein
MMELYRTKYYPAEINNLMYENVLTSIEQLFQLRWHNIITLRLWVTGAADVLVTFT